MAEIRYQYAYDENQHLISIADVTKAASVAVHICGDSLLGWEKHLYKIYNRCSHDKREKSCSSKSGRC